MMHAEGGPPLGAMCKSQIYRLSQSLPNHATSCAVSIACDDEAKGDWKYESKLPCWLKTRRYPCGEDNEDTCFFYKTIAGDKDPAKRPFFRYDEHRKKITFINEQGGRSELFLFDAGGER